MRRCVVAVLVLVVAVYGREETEVWSRTTAGSGSYTVPASVQRIKVVAEGGGGGGGYEVAGTRGGYAEREVDVTPGQVFSVTVGDGGDGESWGVGGAGGGGTGVELDNVVFVVAGGGGGSGDGVGGAGGGLNGADGSGWQWNSVPPGFGATQTGAGAGSTRGGVAGNGRNGGHRSPCGNSGGSGYGNGGCGATDWSAGGGGGYYGGGSGGSDGWYGSGGGGGCGFAGPDGTTSKGMARRAAAAAYAKGPAGLVYIYSVVLCPAGQAASGPSGSCEACPAGTFRRATDDAYSCVDCPAGVYSGDAGRTTVCPTECPLGSYCPVASGSATPCPAGAYGASAGLAAASECRACPAGYYCGAGTAGFPTTRCAAGNYGGEGEATASCAGQCWAGYWCAAGSSAPNPNTCPAGRYGAAGATDAACHGTCAAGYACPEGATSATFQPCGGAQLYCPASDGANPRAVSSGYYSTPTSEAVTRRTGQAPCPAGSYCYAGLQYTCPAGRYGADTGLASNPAQPGDACSGPCEAGYFCGAGATDPREHRCGRHPSCVASPEACYCPAGSAQPAIALPNTYTVPEDGPTDLRAGALPCPQGFNCENGVRLVDAEWEDCPGGVTSRAVNEMEVGPLGDAVVASIESSTPSYSVGTPVPGDACVFAAGGGGTPTVAVDAGGALSLTAPAGGLDHEACAGFTVPVMASKLGTTIVCNVEVAVANVNERPALVGCGDERSVPETSPAKTRIRPAIRATDPDGDAVLYTIVGGTGAALFTVSTCGGIVALGTERVTHGDYTLDIRIEDDALVPLTDTCTVAITVTDANDAPTLADARPSVPELSAANASVVVLDAADADGDHLTFTISRPDIPNAFWVDAAGVLRVLPGAELDFEAKPLHSLQVTVSDGMESATASVLVDVTNVDEAPVLGPVFDVLAIAEDAAPGQSVSGSPLPVSDPDDPTLTAGTYTLTMADTGGGLFDVDSAVRRLVLADGAALDHETAPTVAVAVTATDPAGLTHTLPITVQVTDVNEAPWVDAAQTRSVPEVAASPGGSSRGAAVGAPLTGGDVEHAALLTWSLDAASNYVVPGEPSSGAAFAIGAFTGQLAVAGDLDYEATTAYEVVVWVRDTGGLRASATVTVSVTAVNEPPALHLARLEVEENADAGAAVTAVQSAGAAALVSDPDATDTGHTWVLLYGAGVNDGLFAVDAGTGALSVSAACNASRAVCFNAERPETFEVVVQAADGGGLVATATVPVRVLDVNEAPTLSGRYSAPVPAGLPNGAPVGTLSGYDDDGDELTYSRAAHASAEAQWFDVLPDGTVVVADAPALTALSAAGGGPVVVPVVAADRPEGDPERLTGRGAATMNVLSAALGQPEAPATHAFSVAENAGEDVELGFIVGTLPPSADAAADKLQYVLSTSTPSSAVDLFALTIVDADTGPGRGRLATADAASLANHPFGLDYEWRQSVTLEVVVALGEAITQTTVTVALTDVNEAPAVQPPDATSLVVPEDAAAGAPVGAVWTAFDRDAGDSVLVTVAAAAGEPQPLPFVVQPAGGTAYQLEVSGAGLDHEAHSEWRVVVTAVDQSGVAASAPATVTVRDVNEPPVVAPLAFTLPEDTAPGASAAGWAVVAADPERGPLAFAIAAGNGDGVWAVAPLSGALSLAAGGPGVDAEDAVAHHLVVNCTDAVHVVPVAVTVTVTDVDDLTFDGVAPSVLPTTGGAPVTLAGTNIGRTDGNNGDASPVVTLSADGWATTLAATDCVVVPNTVVTCVAPVGVGTGFAWRLAFGGLVRTSGFTTAFAPPAVTGVEAVTLSPYGGTSVTLTGHGFGPAGTAVDFAVYGRSEQYPADCAVAGDASLVCSASRGVGTRHEWRVSVGGQVSAWSGPGATSSYAGPTVAAAPHAPALATTGGTPFRVRGTGFPPLETADAPQTPSQRAAHAVAVSYGPYTASACTLVAADEVECVGVEGFGAGREVRVVVGAQLSPPSGVTVAYRAPQVTRLRGVGTRDASTAGGESVVIDGTAFGPAGTPVAAMYGPPGAMDLTAVDCVVPADAPHTQIRCLTAQGSGTGHAWQVTVGAGAAVQQASPEALLEVGGRLGTSYAPPVVTSFAGAGSADASTRGGQVVVIDGSDFGHRNSKLGLVTYAPSDPDAAGDLEFEAVSCELLVPHARMQCETAPGAGLGLEWVVRVDGQRSTAPVTWYEQPVVTGLLLGSGGEPPVLRAATDANMDGGEALVVHGVGFGPSMDFVQAVTYGPSGVEYAAQGCAMTVPHTQLTCTTVPGFGAALGVRVRVAGQDNVDPMAVTLSYTPPSVAAVTPSSAATHAAVEVAVDGRFAALDAGAAVAVLFGNPEDGSQVTLAASVSPSPADAASWPPGSPHSLTFFLPVEAVAGAQRAVRVRVSAASGAAAVSAPVPFTFDDPRVEFVTVFDGEPSPEGAYALSMYGESLGTAGSVELLEHTPQGVPVPGAAFSPLPAASVATWQHDLVVVRSDVLWGQLRVVTTSADAAGAPRTVRSVPVAFASVSVSVSTRAGLPPIPEFATQGYVDGVAYEEGSGAWRAAVLSVYLRSMQSAHTVNVTVGAEPCPLVDDPAALEPVYCPGGPDAHGDCTITSDTEWLLRCRMPPGTDVQLGVPVTVVRNGQVGDPFRVWYQRAAITAVSVAGRPPVAVAPGATVYAPTEGADVVVAGTNLGLRPRLEVGPHVVYAPGDAPSPADAVFTHASHTEVRFRLPPGQGDGGGRFRVSFLHGRGSTNDVAFSYDPPVITDVAVAGAAGTAGGAVVTITGTSLGVSPAFTIGPAACGDVAAVTPHFVYTCRLPEGAGTGLAVTAAVAGLTGGWSGTFAYAAPVLQALAVAGAGTVGPAAAAPLAVAAAGGQPATLALAHGGNPALGHTLCVFVSWASLRLSAGGDGALACNGVEDFHGEGEVPAPLVATHTHTSVTFTLPRGVGVRHVWVSVAGQVSTAPLAVTSLPPVIHAFDPATGDTNGGTAVTLEGAHFGVGPADGVEAAEALPPGGWPLVVGGAASLPPWPPAMALHVEFHTRCVADNRAADASCAREVTPVKASLSDRPPTLTTVVAHADDAVVFRTLPGIGVNRTVRVVLTDVRDPSVALASNPVLFSYSPPEVQFVTPVPVDATGGRMTVVGRNFGRPDDVETEAERFVALSVGGTPCGSAQRVDRLGASNLECDDVGVHPVGFLNLTLAVAGQWAELPAPDDRVVAVCPPGWFGQQHEVCLPCPQAEFGGAVCEGDTALLLTEPQAEPRAAAGFYNLNATDCAVAYADDPGAYAKRRHRATCNFVLPCEPAEACLAGNVCGVGYESNPPVYRCADCATGYYRRGGFCERCPDQAWLVLVVFAVVAVAACVVGYILNSNNVNVGFVSIGVDYFQVLGLFANSRVSWPSFLLDMWHYLSAFNFNLEITAPECSIPELSYKSKWTFVMALPLAALAIFLVMHVSMVVLKLLKGRRRNLNRHVSILVSSFLILFYFLYLYITRTVLDVFDCSPTVPDDGKEYLEVVFEECGKPGGIQMTLLPFAIVALVVYVVGYPVLIGAILYRHRERMMEDQLLRAHGTGGSRASNPHAYDTRKRYQRLYYLFTPDRFFWILVIIARKFGLAFTALMFNKNSAFQMSMALLVLIVAYAAQVHSHPFMSLADRPRVISEHVMASYVMGSRHSRLRDSVKEALAHARKSGHTNQLRRRAQSSSDIVAGAIDALGATARWLTNYNTVESVLLFSAVLITLGGIMFESGQFETERFKTQRDLVASIIIVVVFVSILYWTSVFVHEVATVLRASRQAKQASGGRGKAAKGKGITMTGNPMHNLSAMETGTDQPVMQSSVNPMFTKMGAAAAPVAASIDTALETSEPPDEATWAVFRQTFADMRSKLDESVAARRKERQTLSRQYSASRIPTRGKVVKRVFTSARPNSGRFRRAATAGAGTGVATAGAAAGAGAGPSAVDADTTTQQP